MKPFSLAVISVLLSSAPALRAQVLTVANTGPADFTSIRAAIDAAPEGATILVRAGTYNEGGTFEVIDKELVVTGEAGASVRLVNCTLVASDLSAGKTLVLRGLTFAPMPLTEALVVDDCQGTVWLEDSIFEGGTPQIIGGAAAVRVEDGLLVAARSTIAALQPNSASNPVPGLLARRATVHLFETQVTGGRGGTSGQSIGIGGVGVHLVEGSFLFTASSTIQGGPGGTAGNSFFGCTGLTSGMGGTGLVVQGLSEAHLLGTTVAGGPGGIVFGTCTVGPSGEPSEIVDGTLDSVLWPQHGFAVTSPVRASSGGTASFRGVPGEFAWYLFSDSAQALFLPQVLGTLVLDFPLSIVPVGTLDAQGEAQAPLMPALAPGAESLTFLLQSLYFDGASNSFTLSTPAVLVVLANEF